MLWVKVNLWLRQLWCLILCGCWLSWLDKTRLCFSPLLTKQDSSFHGPIQSVLPQEWCSTFLEKDKQDIFISFLICWCHKSAVSEKVIGFGVRDSQPWTWKISTVRHFFKATINQSTNCGYFEQIKLQIAKNNKEIVVFSWQYYCRSISTYGESRQVMKNQQFISL